MSNRPVYDGNPLSWFDNAGNLGVGYYSLDDPDYFKLFENKQSFLEMPYELGHASIKIMYIPNDQPAGNLFYHDHAMRSTKYNVLNGLSGLYILYDPFLEKVFPNRQNEKFILFSAKVGDARDNLVEKESQNILSDK